MIVVRCKLLDIHTYVLCKLTLINGTPCKIDRAEGVFILESNDLEELTFYLDDVHEYSDVEIVDVDLEGDLDEYLTFKDSYFYCYGLCPIITSMIDAIEKYL